MVTKPYLPLFTFTLLVLFVTLLFSSPYRVTANEVAPRRQTSSPVGFLEHLKGSHKGDKVKGINDLKKYLDKYGYLGCKNHNHPEDDFDEHLEEAVRVYQINFNLEPTGILDKETISTMMKPRCGVADIINGTTSMRITKMKHNYSEVPIRLRYKVNDWNLKWPPNKYTLSYGIFPNSPPPCRNPITKAFQIWQKSSHFKFGMTTNYWIADLKLSSHGREQTSDQPFDGPLGMLAHAGYPTEGVFHFDINENWVEKARPEDYGPVDCGSTILHEIGHLLGLDHSSVKASVMYPYATRLFTALHQDDIQGIKALYRV